MKKITKRKVKILLLLFPVYIFVALPAFVCAMISKIFIHDLWLVYEEGYLARDNGYFFFKYVRENYPKQKIIYSISKKSPDYEKVRKIGKTCGSKGFVYWFYYFLCSKEITTNPHDKPFPVISKHQWINKCYFLQHGVIRDFVGFTSDKFKFKLFVTSAKAEQKFVIDNFGFDENVVKLFGLVRHDNLLKFDVKKNQILIMPTWRGYLDKVTDEKFAESEYFNTWHSLLNNKKFTNFIEKNNLNVIFFPHKYAQKFAHLFHSDCKNIEIGTSEKYDIQTLLKESALLVTDYSSVLFDFAYMKKPVMQYEFDHETYYTDHHKKGYFDSKQNIVGTYVEKEDDLINLIEQSYKNNFALSQKQTEKIEGFFEYFDGKCAERTYKFIKEH